MVLDTNAKGFKYSTINKVLCVILCFVTFCSSAWLACFTSLAVANNYSIVYNKVEAKDDWTNSTRFYRILYNNCNKIASDVIAPKEKQDVKNELLKNKDKYVEEAYKLVLKLRAQAEDEADVEVNYDSDGNEVYKTTVYYEYYLDSYSVLLNGSDIYNLDITPQMTKEDISIKFDKAIPDMVENCVYVTQFDASDEIIYYARFSDNVSSSDKELVEESYYNSPYYLIIKNGKVESKGINQTVVEDVVGSLKDNHDPKYFNHMVLYMAFAPVMQTSANALGNAFKYYDNSFSDLYTFSVKSRSTVDNMIRNYVIAAVLLITSFIFGFMYFSITGKKSKDEPSKLVFYDYLPLELSIGAAGGIGFGVGLLLIGALEGIGLSMLAVWCLYIFVVACWILLFFVCASCSRYIRSDKKFYKHLLTYWIFVALWKILKWLFGLAVKLAHRIKESAQRTSRAFGYKPRHFKRNIVLITVGWLLANVLLISIIAIFVVNNAGFVAAFFVLVEALMDFFVIRKLAEYVDNLDKIIDASSRHEEVMLDLDKLDMSLRVLAESMRYTNAELQNAIAKAVKDERLRTELITNVSHDLKTPLTSIISYVDLLSKCDIDDEKAKEYIRVLDEKGGKLKRLIDDLIEASKVTSGNVTVNLVSMNLSELCLQSTIDAQSDFEKAGLELIIKQGEKPSIVIADGSKANRVIENLLSNARKYSAKASRVYVSVYDEGNYGVFEIKNISAQALDITPQELTERFVRGDKSRNQEGNGLGLSIAKELCTLQNGELELIIDGDLFKARVKLPNK